MTRTARPKRWLCACATPSPDWNWNCCTPCMPTPISSPAPRGWSTPGRGRCGWAKRPRPAWTCPTAGGDLVHFHGRHAMERQAQRLPLPDAVTTVSSTRGASSHHHNPFVILCDHDATEETGDCCGVMLAYSGSFRTDIEQTQTAWCASSPASRMRAFAGCWNRGRPLPRPRSSWRIPARAWAGCRGCTIGFCGGMSAAAPGATPDGRC